MNLKCHSKDFLIRFYSSKYKNHLKYLSNECVIDSLSHGFGNITELKFNYVSYSALDKCPSCVNLRHDPISCRLLDLHRNESRMRMEMRQKAKHSASQPDLVPSPPSTQQTLSSMSSGQLGSVTSLGSPGLLHPTSDVQLISAVTGSSRRIQGVDEVSEPVTESDTHSSPASRHAKSNARRGMDYTFTPSPSCNSLSTSVKDISVSCHTPTKSNANGKEIDVDSPADAGIEVNHEKYSEFMAAFVVAKEVIDRYCNKKSGATLDDYICNNSSLSQDNTVYGLLKTPIYISNEIFDYTSADLSRIQSVNSQMSSQSSQSTVSGSISNNASTNTSVNQKSDYSTDIQTYILLYQQQISFWRILANAYSFLAYSEIIKRYVEFSAFPLTASKPNRQNSLSELYQDSTTNGHPILMNLSRLEELSKILMDTLISNQMIVDVFKYLSVSVRVPISIQCSTPTSSNNISGSGTISNISSVNMSIIELSEFINNTFISVYTAMVYVSMNISLNHEIRLKENLFSTCLTKSANNKSYYAINNIFCKDMSRVVDVCVPLSFIDVNDNAYSCFKYFNYISSLLSGYDKENINLGYQQSGRLMDDQLRTPGDSKYVFGNISIANLFNSFSSPRINKNSVYSTDDEMASVGAVKDSECTGRVQSQINLIDAYLHHYVYTPFYLRPPRVIKMLKTLISIIVSYSALDHSNKYLVYQFIHATRILESLLMILSDFSTNCVIDDNTDLFNWCSLCLLIMCACLPGALDSILNLAIPTKHFKAGNGNTENLSKENASLGCEVKIGVMDILLASHRVVCEPISYDVRSSILAQLIILLLSHQATINEANIDSIDTAAKTSLVIADDRSDHIDTESNRDSRNLYVHQIVLSYVLYYLWTQNQSADSHNVDMLVVHVALSSVSIEDENEFHITLKLSKILNLISFTQVVDGCGRNCSSVDLSKHVISIDGAHELLRLYISIIKQIYISFDQFNSTHLNCDTASNEYEVTLHQNLSAILRYVYPQIDKYSTGSVESISSLQYLESSSTLMTPESSLNIVTMLIQRLECNLQSHCNSRVFPGSTVMSCDIVSDSRVIGCKDLHDCLTTVDVLLMVLILSIHQLASSEVKSTTVTQTDFDISLDKIEKSFQSILFQLKSSLPIDNDRLANESDARSIRNFVNVIRLTGVYLQQQCRVIYQDSSCQIWDLVLQTLKQTGDLVEIVTASNDLNSRVPHTVTLISELADLFNKL